MNEHLTKALEQCELATSHLMIALREFTLSAEDWSGKKKTDEQIFYVAMTTQEALNRLQPALHILAQRGIYKIPEGAMKLLQEYDPKNYNQASMVAAAGGKS
jgi:hypothetical protein